MKTRKEFSFNGIAMLINGKIATRGTKFGIYHASKLIEVEIVSIKYRMKGGRKSVTMIAKDENAKEYALKYTPYSGVIYEIRNTSYSKWQYGVRAVDIVTKQPLQFSAISVMVHTYLPFFDLKRMGGGSFVAKAYTKSPEHKLVELNADMLGSYSLSMTDNKYYADFDDLFVDYYAYEEEATIKQTQPKPQPKTNKSTDTQRRFINVIVSVDMNATKEEIMAEIAKSVDSMLG